MGQQRPLHGLRSAHQAVVNTPENLHALAAHYTQQIRAVDPTGPYFLGGNCQGARIAFDIALELQKGGATVALLFVMEALIERPYPARVGLIYGRESQGRNPYLYLSSPETIWERCYGDFIVDFIPGRHTEFFESPAVEALAATLNKRMDEADQAAVGGRKRIG